jgi:hypothetical protein
VKVIVGRGLTLLLFAALAFCGPVNAQAANERASELRGVFETVSALSVRAAAEELTRRGVPAQGGGRWAVAPNAGGAGQAATGGLSPEEGD